MENLIIEKICSKYGKSEKFARLVLKICKDNDILCEEKVIMECVKKCVKNKRQKNQMYYKSDL